MIKDKRFAASSVITTALLVGFLGFGIGFNWPRIADSFNAKYGRKPAQQHLPAQLDYSSLDEIYTELRKNFAAGKLDATKLLDGAKQGLVEASGDPYTSYLNAQEAKNFEEGLNGTFSGIGAEISIKDGRLIVVAPIAGSPAQAAGIKAGDYIVKIGDEDSSKFNVEQAVAKIRGAEGTKVTLNISSEGKPPRDVTITRAIISVPSVKSELKPGNIGYIELSRFGPDTTTAFRKAATDLRSQGATKIILDVRNNPGGLLDSAVEISDEFLDAGKVIVQEKRDGKVIDSQSATAEGSLQGLPTIVLINGGSASASEIIAGSLQDNKAAQLVGEKSFGKGSVQQLIELSKKSVLKVTIALWHTPNGRNISKEGIKPDIEVKRSAEEIEANQDPQLDKALELLR